MARLHRIVRGPGPSPEARGLVVEDRLLYAGAIVRHERSVLGDRLTNGSALQDEYLGTPCSGGHGHRLVGTDDDPGRRTEGVLRHRDRTLEDVERAGGVDRCRRRNHPLGERVEDQVPDGQIGIGARRVGVRRRPQRSNPVDRPGDHRQLAPPPIIVGQGETWHLLVPQHREVGVHHLVLRRQIEPDLEELGGVGSCAVEQREHLAVDDARPRRQPLHITAARTGPWHRVSPNGR